MSPSMTFPHQPSADSSGFQGAQFVFIVVLTNPDLDSAGIAQRQLRQKQHERWAQEQWAQDVKYYDTQDFYRPEPKELTLRREVESDIAMGSKKFVIESVPSTWWNDLSKPSATMNDQARMRPGVRAVIVYEGNVEAMTRHRGETWYRESSERGLLRMVRRHQPGSDISREVKEKIMEAFRIPQLRPVQTMD